MSNEFSNRNWPSIFPYFFSLPIDTLRQKTIAFVRIVLSNSLVNNHSLLSSAIKNKWPFIVQKKLPFLTSTQENNCLWLTQFTSNKNDYCCLLNQRLCYFWSKMSIFQIKLRFFQQSADVTTQTRNVVCALDKRTILESDYRKPCVPLQ